MMMNSWMGSDFTNDDLVKENTLADDYHSKLEPHPSAPEQFYFITLTPAIPKVMMNCVFETI